MNPTPATWTGRAGLILSTLEQLSLPNGKEALYNPLPLKLSPNKLSVRAQAVAKTGYVVAELDFPGIVDEATVTVNALELIKFLKGYESAEEVCITFADPITIKGETRECKVHPEGVKAATGFNIPEFKDGIAQYKSGPATTIVTVDAASLQSVVKDAQLVEVPTFPLHAVPDGGLLISLGGAEAKKNSITRSLPCNVEGPEATTTIGEDFAAVLQHVVGPITLQMSDKPKHPLIIVSGPVKYILLPRVG